MTLITDLTQLRDNLTPLAVDFGIAKYRNLVLKKQVLAVGQTIPTITYINITPKPKFENVPPRLVGQIAANNTIVISNDDLLVKVSRAYSKTTLLDNIDKWLVDAVYISPTTNPSAGYKQYRLIYISDHKNLYWEIVLRMDKDK